jgi:hypothetical protein
VFWSAGPQLALVPSKIARRPLVDLVDWQLIASKLTPMPTLVNVAQITIEPASTEG